MSARLGLIVEGHGEVAALPLLVRRLAVALGCGPGPQLPPPLRVPRGRLVKRGELQRSIELMARKVGPGQPLLVVLDADDDCPGQLGPQLLGWASEARSDRSIAVVVARREIEAWFLGSATSLRGRRGLPLDLTPPEDPESVRDAKGWLAERMPTGYSETADQPALTEVFDLQAVREACPSFSKLVKDVAALLGVRPEFRGVGMDPSIS